MSSGDNYWGDEIWDGEAVLISFEEDGMKSLICQNGIQMSAESQLRLADELKRYALAHYDEIDKLREEQREEIRREWEEWRAAPRPVSTKNVYLMRAGNNFKVGVSKNPSRRVQEVRRHQPEVELVATSKPLPTSRAFEVEKKLHECLASRCITGEWFALRPLEANTISGWITEAE